MKHPHQRKKKISILTRDVVNGSPRVLITTTHAIVLENLSHRFSKPNILDIKLGTKLYDNEATEEKKARMIKTAKETTSLETGVRLTGFQVSERAMICV